MSEKLSLLNTAETFLHLIWKPQHGDRVVHKGKKDVVHGVDSKGFVVLKSSLTTSVQPNEVKFRPTPQDYLKVIISFQPILIQLSEIKPGVFLARCQSGPFAFAVQGRPKALLAKLLNCRLHLVGVNERVNRIVEEARQAGIKNAPHLRIVPNTTETCNP